MPYYHATYREHIPSILRHGLGGRITTRNFPDSEPGLYISEHITSCFYVMLEHMMESVSDDTRPSDVLDTIRIIVIDDSRLVRERLQPDPNTSEWAGCWIYDGVIDVIGLPILTVDETMAGMPSSR